MTDTYFILGALTINALKQSFGINYKSVISAVGICFTYAVSDELHQFFVPGRAPGIKDVFIDTSGAIVGIIALIIILKVFVKQASSTKHSENMR